MVFMSSKLKKSRLKLFLMIVCLYLIPIAFLASHVGNMIIDNFIRCSTSKYINYFHMPTLSFNPGASGATFTVPDGNQLGGWNLTLNSHILYSQSDIHPDWDGASDPTLEMHIENGLQGVAGGDTIDLQIIFYYKGHGDTTTKTQTVIVATVVGTDTQYSMYDIHFVLDWDLADNVLEKGDVVYAVISIIVGTSEVDDVNIVDAAIWYPTTHVGREQGDV